MQRAASLIFCLALLMGHAARANTVEASLVSSTSSAVPGASFEVAIHFTVPPGWHMYWLNPGQAGAPPKVKWNLPEGVTAGPLKFPTPQRIDLPENLTAYGYERDFALLTTIQIDPNFDADRPIDLMAAVNWVVCSDVCKFEMQNVAASIAIGPSAEQNRDQFATWRAAQPLRLPEADPRVDIAIGRPAGRGVLSVAMPGDLESATNIHFVPPPIDSITFDQPAGRHAIVDGMMITQPFVIEPGPHENVQSVAVLSYTDGKKQHQSIELPVDFRFNQK